MIFPWKLGKNSVSLRPNFLNVAGCVCGCKLNWINMLVSCVELNGVLVEDVPPREHGWPD